MDNYHFLVGDLLCIAIDDGRAVAPIDNIARDVPLEQLEQALRESGYSTAETTMSYNCLYIRAGSHHILIDTGLGQNLQQRDEALMAKYHIRLPRIERDGSLLDHLHSEGIAAGDIDLIVLTHEDGDHVGGIADADGDLVFPNASYILPREAWDFWSDEALVARLPDLLTASGRKTLPLIRDRIQVVDTGVEFLPGFELISAPGHRPGHSAVAITSRGEHLLHLADTAGHPVFMAHPSWHGYADSWHDLAAEDRIRLLTQATGQRALIFGSHLPFPGLGRVAPQEAGWRWQPVGA
jgi:glyoxylase-like metal-dependent hydrolase (beta-lactamase superfamily II)